MFVGKHEHAIDEKGRVVLPARFRHQIGERGYVTQLDSCIGLYDEGGFADEVTKWKSALDEGRISRRVYRKFTYSVAEVRVDSAGRISLPRELLDRLGFGERAVVAGSVERVEIWPAEAYEDDLESSDVDDELARAVSELGL